MSGTRPRKVFLVADQLALGGAENQLVLLARSLHRRGIETVVLVMFGGGPHEAALRDEGITVVYLGFRGGREIPRDPANTFAAFIRLVRLLRREKPDVVHAFLYYAYVVVAPAARLAGVPVVVAGRRNMGFYKENSKKKAMLAVERVATRMTDRVIAISRAVAENTVRQEGLDANKITTVYNGLAPEAFDEVMPAAIDTALPVVLCVANLRSSKGHKYLIEAMGLLEERGIAGTLLLVGDGVEREGLEEQARRLSADIRFLGLRQDVAALLRRADVFVLPSVSEGLSTAVMEAMAACVPVVATASGGPPELLEGRGLVVPPGDAAALADALATLLADRERARDLAVKAQAWARSHLTLDAMVDEHVQIYSELLARARTR
ncbi:glycosyltransferase [Microbispora sp. GKU 823]|uniref:glycosyltransferase n=1 Tax=Microbispora sp. GKU 823 TaxID=1652100 RepID=UPI0021185210|nr:glycosyltransferase [Microbispora sp. GKU 823]